MQMDGRLKEPQVSLPRSTDLSLIKGDRRHGDVGMLTGSVVTRNIDPVLLCNPCLL